MTPLLALALVAFLAGCGTSRVVVVTGTTIGLKATPGDGASRPPQVTFGYKRAEASLVPTKGEAVQSPKADAFSTLAALHFETRFFGKTELDSFISTGGAALAIQQQKEFQDEIKEAAKARGFRLNNRAQLDAVLRITQRYRLLSDAGKREAIRREAERLELVPPGTTDAAFAGGKLQDSAVNGRSPVTTKLRDLEVFTATVAQ